MGIQNSIESWTCNPLCIVSNKNLNKGSILLPGSKGKLFGGMTGSIGVRNQTEADFVVACRNLDFSKIKELQKKSDFNSEYCLEHACRYGNKKIVKYILKQGTKDYNCGLWHACDSGNLKVAKLMIRKGATDFSKAFSNILHRICKQSSNFKIDLVMLKLGIRLLNCGQLWEYILHDKYQSVIKYAIEKHHRKKLKSIYICNISMTRRILKDSQKEFLRYVNY